jgi:hypothetical protein
MILRKEGCPMPWKTVSIMDEKIRFISDYYVIKPPPSVEAPKLKIISVHNLTNSCKEDYRIPC